MRVRMLFAAVAVLLAVFTFGVASSDNGALTITLDSVNNSGISGSAQLIPKGKQTEVKISVANEPVGASEPVHVHNGPCTRLDPVPLYPLRNVEEGTSDTTLDMPLSALTTGRYVINIHKSAADFGTYVACGPIPRAAATGAGGATTTTLTWNTRTNLPVPLFGFSVAVAHDHVYTIGGTSSARQPVARVDQWNPSTNTWTTAANLPSARTNLAVAVTANGKVFAFGGEDNTGVTGTVDEFDPVANTWTDRANLSTPRSDLAAAGVGNGMIYVVGGMDADGKSLATVEAYDPAKNTWTSKASMPTPRADLGLVMVSGKLYAIGGTADGKKALGTVEAYDPATNTWSAKADMPTPRLLFGAVASNNKIYVLGGAYPGVEYTGKVEVYDPSTNTWATNPDLPTPRSSLGAFTLANGHIYVAGGCCLGADLLSTVDEGTFGAGPAPVATAVVAPVAAAATTAPAVPTAANAAPTAAPTAAPVAPVPTPAPAPQSFPILPIVGVVVVLAAIGAGVGLTRRRSPAAPSTTTPLNPTPTPTPVPISIPGLQKSPSWPNLPRTSDSGAGGIDADKLTVVMPWDGDRSGLDLSASGYFLEGEPKNGGMASVYRARQPSLDRDVAIKLLSPLLAVDPSFVQRFYEEARRTARLEHPNIVPIYDIGQAPNGSLYLVMRYIDGLSLQELLALEHALALPRALRLVRQVGEALAYAHNRGIIHRDVKPSNIMIEGGDRATLMDFGIAKLNDGGGVTRPGVVVGTPKYVSPEQAAGEQVDARSDLYSLGVVLYEMVAGRPPFESDSARGLLQAHLLVTPPPPTQFNPAIPPALESIILKALEKDRSARYQTAEALVADLGTVEIKR